MSYYFCNINDPTFSKALSHAYATLTIQQPYVYSHSGKLCNMLSVTLMIQRPYIVDCRLLQSIFVEHKKF